MLSRLDELLPYAVRTVRALELIDLSGSSVKDVYAGQCEDLERPHLVKNRSIQTKIVDKYVASILKRLHSTELLCDVVNESVEYELTSVVELIFEGLLEVEIKGEFRTGPSVARYLDLPKLDLYSDSPTNMISIDALKYAAKLGQSDAACLAARLYFYNRVPFDRTLFSAFGTPDKVLSYLGFDEPSARLILRDWRHSRSGNGDGWHYWKHRNRAASSGNSRNKIYIAARFDVLPDAIRMVLPLLETLAVSMFKLPVDAVGLLRPDKFLLYFSNEYERRAAAEQLYPVLCGLPVQVVPFTAASSKNGILSWGVDPPPRAATPTSWRLWLCEVLARSIVEGAVAEVSSADLVPYALLRAALEGVDVATWAIRERD